MHGIRPPEPPRPPRHPPRPRPPIPPSGPPRPVPVSGLVRACAVFAVYLAVAACADPGPAADAGGSEELAAVAEDVWQRQLDVDLRARAREGLRLDRLPVPTLDRAEADAAFSRRVLERLEAIDSDVLGVQDRLTWEVLQRKASLNIEGLDHYWVITNVLTPYSSPIGGLRALFAMVPVADAQGREDFLTLLSQVPEAVAFVEAHTRGQMERGVVVPEPNMDAVVGIVRASTAPFDDGPFAVALVRLGAESDDPNAEGDAAAFLAEAARIVEEEINPRFSASATSWMAHTGKPRPPRWDCPGNPVARRRTAIWCGCIRPWTSRPRRSIRSGCRTSRSWKNRCWRFRPASASRARSTTSDATSPPTRNTFRSRSKRSGCGSNPPRGSFSRGRTSCSLPNPKPPSAPAAWTRRSKVPRPSATTTRRLRPTRSATTTSTGPTWISAAG